jgi:subtilisin family serine protease
MMVVAWGGKAVTWKTWVLVIASVLISVILSGGRVFAADAEERQTDEGKSRKIVLFQEGTPSAVQRMVVALSGSTVVLPLSFIDALVIELPVGKLDEAIAFLLNFTVLGLPPVVGVYDNLAVSVLPIAPALPGEVSLQEGYDWGLKRIGVEVARQEMPTLTGAGVNVAVVDTGIACGHPDLPLLIDGFNALPGGVLYCDDHGHGTHMAGIIAARSNRVAIRGAAPQASLVAVKVLDAKGKGYLSYLLNGLQWIYNNQNEKNIRLVNMSLRFSADSPALKRAIKKLVNHNTIMVASAGNSCSDDPGQDESGGDDGEGPTCDTPQTTGVKYPAAYPEVLAVTATNENDRIACYSLAGPEVDVTAPGGERERPGSECERTDKRILSTFLGDWYGLGSGTSQAAAHVTGTLALKLQQQRDLSLDDVRRLLQRTAKVLAGYSPAQQGWGLIDAECLLDPTLLQCPPR